MMMAHYVHATMTIQLILYHIMISLARTSMRNLQLLGPPLKEAWAKQKVMAKKDAHYARYEQDPTNPIICQ